MKNKLNIFLIFFLIVFICGFLFADGVPIGPILKTNTGSSNLSDISEINKMWSAGNWQSISTTMPMGTIAYHKLLNYNNLVWLIAGYNAGVAKNFVYSTSDMIHWTVATSSANFSGRYAFGNIVHNNKMWVAGGYNNTNSFRDVWWSTNGKDWTCATTTAAFYFRYNNESNLLSYNNKLWIIGGYASGTGMTNDVWSSSDGANWTQVTSAASWPVRFGHSTVVFNNKMWVMCGEGLSSYLNDVWYSTDGITWTCATTSANFDIRGTQTCNVYGNKMFVLGGTNSGGRKNDVWSSTDGITWKCETIGAQWTARYAHATVVFGSNLFLVAGYDGSYKQDSYMGY